MSMSVLYLHLRLPLLTAGSRRSTVNLGMMHISGMYDVRYQRHHSNDLQYGRGMYSRWKSRPKAHALIGEEV